LCECTAALAGARSTGEACEACARVHTHARVRAVYERECVCARDCPTHLSGKTRYDRVGLEYTLGSCGGYRRKNAHRHTGTRAHRHTL
jgi:hypothetical protein